MSYPSRIEVRNAPREQSRIGIAYSTKDRTDLSIRTLEPLRAAGDFDLYWMDGSRTEEGAALPSSMAPTLPPLCEIHYGVTGGPDVAIVYSLTYMLQKGYEYVGLIENDVLLESGWLERLMGLFEQGTRDGLRVGAVSARTIRERTVVKHDDYAVMFNLGAGMILLSREAAIAVLDRFRTTNGEEVRGIVRARTGLDIMSTGFSQTGSSGDWFFDVALMLDGFCSLAPIPSMANNIDADLSKWGCSLVTDTTKLIDSPVSFEIFRRLHQANFESSPKQLAHYPGVGRLVFPHQLATAVPESVGAGWGIVWRQVFGPFAFESRVSGATVSVPLFGTPVAFLVEGGPQGGEVVLRVGASQQSFSLLREKTEIFLINCSVTASDGTPVELVAMTPKVVFCGIQLLEHSFTFPSARSFDFNVLRPLVDANHPSTVPIEHVPASL